MAESYNALCGIVAVNGSLYWFTSRADRVVALDLGDDERVTSFQGPPGVRPIEKMGDALWKDRVTSVHARLGVAVPSYEVAQIAASTMTVEVWVLNGVEWSRMYCLRDSNRILMTPHLTHGKYVVSVSWYGDRRLYQRKVVGGSNKDVGDGRVSPLQLSEGAEMVLNEETRGWLRTFAYVETREPVPGFGV
ncbi:unnamed protein product [Urochloa humidicola]